MTRTEKLFLLLFFGAGMLAGAASCTSNTRAKKWGGSHVVELPMGRKLVNATWKDSNLWYLTRAAKPGETPEELKFTEDSNFGILEGTIIFKEK